MATVVEGDQKAPFSIATTGEGATPFPVVAIENRAFRSPSTTVANFTFIYIYIYIEREREGGECKVKRGRT